MLYIVTNNAMLLHSNANIGPTYFYHSLLNQGKAFDSDHQPIWAKMQSAANNIYLQRLITGDDTIYNFYRNINN